MHSLPQNSFVQRQCTLQIYNVVHSFIPLESRHGIAAKSMDSGAKLPDGCVTLGKLLNLSVPQFPHQ